MTIRGGDALRETDEHPDRLFWYVSGRLEPEEARPIETHLEGCRECQAAVRTLGAWSSTVLSRPQTDAHPGPEVLDAWLSSSSSMEPMTRQHLEGHLDACSACREDLEALRRSYRDPATLTSVAAPLGAPQAAGRRRGMRRWSLAACLVLALAAPVVWLLLSGRGDVPVLMPSTRSASSTAVLRELPGAGPWQVMVVPPSEAVAGLYRLWIERPDGTMVARLGAHKLAVGKDRFAVEVPELPEPGVYRLALAAPGQGAEAIQIYPFRVVPRAKERGE